MAADLKRCTTTTSPNELVPSDSPAKGAASPDLSPEPSSERPHCWGLIRCGYGERSIYRMGLPSRRIVRPGRSVAVAEFGFKASARRKQHVAMLPGI